MSKKTKPAQNEKRRSPKRRKAIVITGIIMSLLLASVALGQWGGFFATKQKRNKGQQATVTTQSLNDPASPSKEYIYIGSRLIATEEPSTGCTAPQPPTGLAAVPGDGQVTLSWNSVSGITYNVKRSTTSGTGYNTIASGISASPYPDTSVTNGTTYYYVLSALSGTCESANSAEVAATPTGGGSGTNNAAFVSQSVPTSMTVGQSYGVSVTMTNTLFFCWAVLM